STAEEMSLIIVSPKAASAFMVPSRGSFREDYQRPRRCGSAAVARAATRRLAHFAAITMISTLYCGAASLASTVARAGVLPGDTQASHTAFISLKVFMSVIQILARRSFDLSVPHLAR